jgi:hypothetical protein
MSPLMALISIHSAAWNPFAVCENSFVQAGDASNVIPGAWRKSHDQPGTGNDEFIPGKHDDQAAEPGREALGSDGITPAVLMCEMEHKIAELQLRLLVCIIQQHACHGAFPLMLEDQRGQLPEHIVRACNMSRPVRVGAGVRSGKFSFTFALEAATGNPKTKFSRPDTYPVMPVLPGVPTVVPTVIPFMACDSAANHPNGYSRRVAMRSCLPNA